MSKLERYLEFNWPALTSGVDGSAEDQAIHVIRRLSKGLDRDSRELGRASDINKELVDALKEAIEWDGHDEQGVKAVWLDKAQAALAKAAGEGDGG